MVGIKDDIGFRNEWLRSNEGEMSGIQWLEMRMINEMELSG